MTPEDCQRLTDRDFAALFMASLERAGWHFWLSDEGRLCTQIGKALNDTLPPDIVLQILGEMAADCEQLLATRIQ